jgi:hypothetical protein
LIPLVRCNRLRHAPLIPLTEPLSKNPALQSSTGIVNSVHVWGTQPLVILMLICGYAGIGLLYYGQKNEAPTRAMQSVKTTTGGFPPIVSMSSARGAR